MAKIKCQTPTQVIDVADWQPGSEEYLILPGTRVKTTFFCSSNQYSFCQHGRPYLFKLSPTSKTGEDKYPEEFWMEVFAYQLGCALGVEVPPAFVAINSQNGKTGALIEWFLKGKLLPGLLSSHSLFIKTENFFPGGDFIQNEIPNYDRKKGTQHNFISIAKLCERLYSEGSLYTDWQSYWAEVLTFDALLGNGDRHQENWGFIKTIPFTISLSANAVTQNLSNLRLAPAFDNSSSMGREIFTENFSTTDLKKYIQRGKHHMRWDINTPQMGHAEMLVKFCQTYPQLQDIILQQLSIHTGIFEEILSRLTEFDIPKPFVKLSQQRANFMLKLTSLRQKYLLEMVEKAL